MVREPGGLRGEWVTIGAEDLGAAPVRDFLAPRDVRVGDGAVSQAGDVLARWHVAPGDVLVVCDQALPGLGYTAPLAEALESAGYTPHVFDGVVGEPDLAVAEEVVDRVRGRAHVAVVGMGGGSSLDLAKVGAALATSPGGVLDHVGLEKVQGTPLPLLLIPTTAGTGAEATRIAMISHEGEKRILNDPRLLPLGALLDPELVASLPPAATAATGLDALSHAIECILSTSATPLTTRVALDAVELLSDCLPRAYADGTDMSARRGTLYGAYLAGLGLNAGVVLGHSIAYTIANRVHLPHGITAAMALPYCAVYAAEHAGSRLGQAFERVGSAAQGHPTLYAWLDALGESLGVPASLESVGLPESEAPAMAAECMDRYARPTNPVALELGPLEELYGYMWRGDLSAYAAARGAT